MKLSDVKVIKVAIKLEGHPIENLAQAVADEFNRAQLPILPGDRIAVAVGSRGIARLRDLVRELVNNLKDRGARPFVIPAMGSHGGATGEGQKSILREYGITEENVGAPVLSSMEVVELQPAGEAGIPIPVFMDRYAYEADGVMVINRVKPHTDFHGDNESGLAKMLVIGLGKHAQALAIHRYMTYGLRSLIPQVAQAVIQTGKIIGGLAVVEDGYDQPSLVKVVPANELMSVDAALLSVARKMMPRLPVDRVDVLIVDCMGKNISGTGMDTNVIGRMNIRGEAEPGSPQIKRIVALDLTPESHGNALGIGLADVVTQQLVNQVDWAVTYENVITSRFLERGFMPVVQPSDAEAIRIALETCGPVTAKDVRLVRIHNTLHLSEMYVSEAVWAELEGHPDVISHGRFEPLSFDEEGAISPF